MLSGALIDFFLAGSTTPDAVYANPDLDESLGVTVTCDSGGLPTSDGNAPVTIWRGTSAFRVRLRRADGTTVWDLDDQAGAFSSASIQSSRIVGERIGYVGSTLPNSQWVFANGKTIGSAASNATARASDSSDTLFLYTLLWVADSGDKLAILTSAGSPTTKGDSAGADFLANKALSLPNYCGKVEAGADNMGGQASANLLTGLSGGIDGDIPFNDGGGESVTLTEAKLPVIDPDSKMTDPAHLHATPAPNSKVSDAGTDNAVVTNVWRNETGVDSSTNTSNAATGITFANIGSGEAHNNVQPTIIVPSVLIYAGNP